MNSDISIRPLYAPGLLLFAAVLTQVGHALLDGVITGHAGGVARYVRQKTALDTQHNSRFSMKELKRDNNEATYETICTYYALSAVDQRADSCR